MIKLLKYEFKATYKTFLMLFLGLYIFCVAFGITMGRNDDMVYSMSNIITTIFMLMIVIIIISIGVMTTITNIVRYKKNILGGEGYLMNTLPVPAWQLVLSKALMAVFWSLVSIFVIVTATLLATIIVNNGTIFYMFEQIKKALQMLDKTSIKFVTYILSLFISMFDFYLVMYFAFSLGASFNRNKVLIAFVFLIIYKMIIPTILEGLFGGIYVIINQELSLIFGTGMSLFGPGNGVYVLLVFKIVEFIVFFLGTSYILKNKLNLE